MRSACVNGAPFAFKLSKMRYGSSVSPRWMATTVKRDLSASAMRSKSMATPSESTPVSFRRKRPAGHQHPQRRKPALARLAFGEDPLHRGVRPGQRPTTRLAKRPNWRSSNSRSFTASASEPSRSLRPSWPRRRTQRRGLIPAKAKAALAGLPGHCCGF
jgi:hypothetical protein